ncbi:hypothetical protein CsatB_011219 [Cannabis sativa]
MMFFFSKKMVKESTLRESLLEKGEWGQWSSLHGDQLPPRPSPHHHYCDDCQQYHKKIYPGYGYISFSDDDDDDDEDVTTVQFQSAINNSINHVNYQRNGNEDAGCACFEFLKTNYVIWKIRNFVLGLFFHKL